MRNREAEVVATLARSPRRIHLQPVDEQAAARRAAEKDIFGHAEFVDERELLRDDGDTRVLGASRIE